MEKFIDYLYQIRVTRGERYSVSEAIRDLRNFNIDAINREDLIEHLIRNRKEREKYTVDDAIQDIKRFGGGHKNV